MPLDARKRTHIATNRGRIRAGRTETIVLIAAGGGTTGTLVVDEAVWHDRHDGGPTPVAYGLVPAMASRTTGTVGDATVELPGAVSVPSDLRYIARTATTGGVATAPRYAVIDVVRVGLGTAGSGGGMQTGNRWRLHVRRLP